MKLVRIGIVLVFLALSVLYGTLITSPSEGYSDLIGQQLAAVTKRHKDLAPLLTDPEKNGFLNPNLGDYWGRKDYKGPIKDTLFGWSKNFSMQGSGHFVDHATLSKNPGYLDLRKALVALLPDLVRAAGTSLIFRPPVDNFPMHTAAFNDSALKTVAMAVNGYAESLVAEGSPGKAVLAYELVFRLGQKVGAENGAVQALFGVSLQGLAFQSLVSQIRPDTKLTYLQWAGLSNTVASTTPTPATLLIALQNDLAAGTAFLKQPRGSYDGEVKYLRGVYLLPGIQARDLRIYHNAMGSIISELLDTGHIAPGQRPEGWGDYFSGRLGSGTELLIPPDGYSRTAARLEVHTAKMAGLAAMAAVCAYRSKFGNLPASLAELDKLGLRTPQGVPYSAARGGYIYEVHQGGRAVLGVLVSPETFAAAGLNIDVAEQVESRNSLYFSIRKRGFLFKI